MSVAWMTMILKRQWLLLCSSVLMWWPLLVVVVTSSGVVPVSTMMSVAGASTAHSALLLPLTAPERTGALVPFVVKALFLAWHLKAKAMHRHNRSPNAEDAPRTTSNVTTIINIQRLEQCWNWQPNIRKQAMAYKLLGVTTIQSKVLQFFYCNKGIPLRARSIPYHHPN